MAITVADLRAKLGYEDDQTQDDLKLADVLAAAVEVVEGEVGSLSPVEVTETVSGSLLARWPVLSVTTPDVTLLPGGAVTLPYGVTEVTYTYGRAEPTAAQRLAVLLVAQDMWETYRGEGFPQDDTGQYVLTPILHRRVRELLAPTRLGPSVA